MLRLRFAPLSMTKAGGAALDHELGPNGAAILHICVLGVHSWFHPEDSGLRLIRAGAAVGDFFLNILCHD